jgi:hypothetical protein
VSAVRNLDDASLARTEFSSYRYPIPILADNVAAILIAKSPTHTKYARHIELRTHYIRSVLPFRDFILAYVKSMWNFVDSNTKAVTPEIFRRLSSIILNGLHNSNWRQEVEKTLIDIWQQTKARDDAREMEQHVKQFGDTRREQRARSIAKERELLKQAGDNTSTDGTLRETRGNAKSQLRFRGS